MSVISWHSLENRGTVETTHDRHSGQTDWLERKIPRKQYRLSVCVSVDSIAAFKEEDGRTCDRILFAFRDVEAFDTYILAPSTLIFRMLRVGETPRSLDWWCSPLVHVPWRRSTRRSTRAMCPDWHLPFPYRIGTWSVASLVFVLIPTRSGEPRLVATHSPGKYLLLKQRAKAPSWNEW